MSNVPGEPYSGPLAFDLSYMRGLLFDIVISNTARLRREQPGVETVVQELDNSVAVHGAPAGVSGDVYARFLRFNDNLAKIRAVLGPLEKLLEVLKESEAKYEHERENTISQMADAVRSTAKRESNPGILAPFEKLLRYNSQVAAKAAKTRRKNTAEAEAAPPEDAG